MTQSDGRSQQSTSLAGLKVLDLSRVLAAPLAAQILGDMGAEVVKIERPISGDDSRNIGGVALSGPTGPTSERSFFLSCNRNKQSLTLDLANASAQDILKRLAATADVLIENYKVGTLAKYGLDYESLAAVNPRLIYCSVTGYGQNGPRASEPGYDPVFQPEGYDVTFGEMSAEEKHGWNIGKPQALSHRARAFKLFVETCLEA